MISVAWFETDDNPTSQRSGSSIAKEKENEKKRKRTMTGGAIIKAYESHSLEEFEIPDGLQKSLASLPIGILEEIRFVNKCKHLLVKVMINDSYVQFILFDVKSGDKVFEMKNDYDKGTYKLLDVVKKPEQRHIKNDDIDDDFGSENESVSSSELINDTSHQ